MRHFFEIVTDNLFEGAELTFNVYAMINERHVVVLPAGFAVNGEKITKLGDRKLFVAEEDTELFQAFLSSGIKDPAVSSAQKAKSIKNVAYRAIEGLFTRQDLAPVMKDAANMIDSMVEFVTTQDDALANLLTLSGHSYYTYNHSVNVAVYTLALAQRMFAPSKDELKEIALGGFLHDVGKKHVPLAIINKPGKLTEQEWAVIQQHPTWGLEIVQDQPYATSIVKAIVHQHHENFNGSGYPQGLEKDQIHPYARVAAIADVFDAMTSKRSYSEPLNADAALQILVRNRGIKFDPKILAKFMEKFNS